MSRDNILARLGLLHLEDKPKELREELHRRTLIHDNMTEEDLIASNESAARWGLPQIDIPKYLKEREEAKREYKESQK